MSCRFCGGVPETGGDAGTGFASGLVSGFASGFVSGVASGLVSGVVAVGVVVAGDVWSWASAAPVRAPVRATRTSDARNNPPDHRGATLTPACRSPSVVH